MYSMENMVKTIITLYDEKWLLDMWSHRKVLNVESLHSTPETNIIL